MSTEIVNVSQGIITFKVSGQISQAGLAAAQKQAGEIIKKEGKVRFLVLVENLTGAEKNGDWNDVSFQMKYDSFIEKIAIVGEKRWEDVALLFTGQGVRRVSIQYFLPGDLEKAKAWLAE